MTTRHEVEVDTRIAAAYAVVGKALARLTSAEDSVKWFERNPRFASQIDDAQKQVTVAREAYNEAVVAYLTLQEEYAGWTRFFLVQNSNGHVHSSLHCTTCFTSTEYAWLPQLSGLDEAAAVEECGSKLCTICYPSAPVEWTNGSRLGREEAEAKAARAQAKAEREAKKVAKSITAPDGSVLRVTSFGRSERIDTLAAAKQQATDAAERLVDDYLRRERPELVREAADALNVLADAIAAKLGTTANEEIANARQRAARRK